MQRVEPEAARQRVHDRFDAAKVAGVRGAVEQDDLDSRLFDAVATRSR